MDTPRLTPSGSAHYAEAVPAVTRALDVLECLHREPGGLSLSQISRAIRVSPSSLLAILRTLSRRGYVDREEATGLYRLSPLIGTLANESDENMALQRSSDAIGTLAHAVLAASTASDHPDGRQEALFALGLAARHLSALLLGEKDSGNPPKEATVTEPSGPLKSDELDQFLDGGWIATLSCLKESGYPYSVPVWYQWENGRFFIVPHPRAEWARYLESNPRVSIAVSEPHPPFRRVLAEGNAEPLLAAGSAERSHELSERMAVRYLGPEATTYLRGSRLQAHRAFVIVPEKLVTWRGLSSHPRYGDGDQRVSRDDQGVA